jgi:hypothetical protein
MVDIFKGKSGSYYRNEKERLKKLIEEPLLELVLQHLPHLQIGKEQQDNAWEIIAIKINNQLIKDNFEAINNIPTLNGLFVKDIYESSMKEFKRGIPFNYEQTGDIEMVRRGLTTRKQRLLLEIFIMLSYDIEVMAKLAKEHYEESQRKIFQHMMSPEKIDYNPENLLDQFQQNHDNVKLQVFEEELEKRAKKIQQLVDENKQLLELNHELLEEQK